MSFPTEPAPLSTQEEIRRLLIRAMDMSYGAGSSFAQKDYDMEKKWKDDAAKSARELLALVESLR